MRRLWFACALCVCLTSASQAVDRVVGVTSPTDVVLCKRLEVSGGTVVAGVEIVSNDVETVFPTVRIRDTPPGDGAQGPTLAAASHVGSNGVTGHRFVAPLGPLFFAQPAQLWVEVVLPAGGGANGVGSGPGIGAVAVDGQTASYLVNAADSELVPIDSELCVALVTSPLSGKTSAPEPTRPNVEPVLRVEDRGSHFAIRLALAQRGSASVSVYDVRGRLVRTFFDATLSAGAHDLLWDTTGPAGVRMSSGVYFVVARVRGAMAVERAVVVR